MINNVIFQGYLTSEPVYRLGENGKKASCWIKIGVYQGKDANGNDLESMFIGATCFGTEAETMKNAHTGDLAVISGRFTETKSVGNDGKEYLNKNVTGNAKLCVKAPASTQYSQPVPTAQPMPQPTYQYNAQQYAQPNPQAAMDPWAGGNYGNNIQ